EDVFTQRAVQVALLPGATPLAEVSSASATGRAVPEQETEPAIEVTPAEVAIGDTITTDGTGFDPDSDVTVTYVDSAGDEVGQSTVTTDGDGGFTVDFVVPEGTAPGTLTVEATQGDNVATATTERSDERRVGNGERRPG